MLSNSAIIFLKKHPPFSLLNDQSLGRLVEQLRIELYPAGARILQQGTPTSHSLYIIKEGSIRIFAQNAGGHEHLIDYRDAGETFGFLSLCENTLFDATVQAVSDTACYVMDCAVAKNLLDEHPSFRDYLVPSYFPKRGNRTIHTPVGQIGSGLGSERVIFTTPVRDLAVREVMTARADLPITEAARLMSIHRAGALVIMDASEKPLGIVTSTDLRDKVVARQKNPADPVGEIMSSPLVTIDGSAYCYEALLSMLTHDVHHLLVMDSGRLVGIVSNHDFLVLQSISPLILIREIEHHETVDGIAAVSKKVVGLLSTLLGAGAGADSILRIITTVNDRIERKIIDMALTTLGPPPLPFCWIVYGSAGRKEQTFRTDQDNAIIFDNPEREGDSVLSAEYFSRFAEYVVAAFLRCGFSLCPGDFMATNALWRQPLAVWLRNFSNWIRKPSSESIHYAVNLFDFRGLHGDLGLSSELKKHLTSALRNQQIFLKSLAELTVDYRPPLGIFGTLVFEKGGDYPNHLDLKEKCLTPLINIVRLFSFECQIPETSTIERIAALKNVHPVMKNVGDDFSYAFEIISFLRLRHQLEQASMNIEPDNLLDPRRLSSLEVRNIREISRLIARVIDDISSKYGTGTRL